MNDRATAFEAAWTEAEANGSLSWGGEFDILPELQLAVALRRAGTSIAEPDWEALWDELVDELASDLTAPPLRLVSGTRRPARSRKAHVAAAALAAAVLVSGVSIGAAGASPGSLLYPVRRALERGALLVSIQDSGIHLRIAWARQADLMEVLRDGRFDLAPALAEDLMAARRVAAQSADDVRPLDLTIARDVPPALAGAPASVREAVRRILGSLIPGDQTMIVQGTALPNRTADRISGGLLPVVPAGEKASQGRESDDPAPSASDQGDQDGSSADIDRDDGQGDDHGGGDQGDPGDDDHGGGDQGGGDDQGDAQGGGDDQG